MSGEGPMHAVLPEYLSAKLGARLRSRGVQLLPRLHAVAVVEGAGG